MKKTEFLWPVRVYYEDTDSGGVVYYANYLRFMERARTEFLRKLGYEQDQLQQQSGIIFAVHSVNIQYKRPARFNDSLNVVTTIASLGKASIQFVQKIYHADAPADIAPLCSAEIKIACLNAKHFSIQILPVEMLEKIKAEVICGS